MRKKRSAVLALPKTNEWESSVALAQSKTNEWESSVAMSLSKTNEREGCVALVWILCRHIPTLLQCLENTGG
jgi:hypothetical protein